MARFDRYDVIPVVVLIAVAIAAAIAIAIWLDQSGRSVYAAQSTFDHSGCQYPFRVTNPPDACDNSDPACPAEIKGGTCDEKGEYVPIIENPVAPAASQSVKTSTCIGE